MATAREIGQPGAGSFRRKLTESITVTIAALVLVTTSAMAWLVANRLEGVVLAQGRSLSEQFAAQSVFAVLVADTEPAVAERALATARTFPGIRYVELRRTDLSLIAAAGEAEADWDIGALLQAESLRGHRPHAQEDLHFWHFVARIEVPTEATPDGERQRASGLVGYLHLAAEKAPLHRLIWTLTATNGLLALIASMVLISWLASRVKRLTEPLSALAHVMQTQDQPTPLRAEARGPLEVRQIAEVFNELMARLERQAASLESQVQIRTLELKEARDAALAAWRHKSEFMAAVTHEMRTPLHAIAAYAQHSVEALQFLAEDPTATQAREYQAIVLREARDLLVRIDQILDLARMEAGKMDVKLHEVNLDSFIAFVRSTVGPMAAHNRNRLSIEREGGAIVVIDEDKLLHILLNLLTNACNFTSDGEIAAHVACDERSLQISVRDTGVGIPVEHHERVFEPFTQVDMSETRKHKGTGLGLAITKRFCELLGGSIGLTSREGKGTEIRVSIPLPVRGVPAAADRAAEAAPTGYEQ